MADMELAKLTISELASRIRSRQISPVEVTETALAQADRLQPILNSFITVLHEQAIAQARDREQELMRGEYRGPLHGIPIGIKDNIATAGVRTTVGSKVLADHLLVEHGGRLMVLNLHPWLMGQPFRIGCLSEALEDITGHQGVWSGTGSEVVDWYLRNAPSQ